MTAAIVLLAASLAAAPIPAPAPAPVAPSSSTPAPAPSPALPPATPPASGRLIRPSGVFLSATDLRSRCLSSSPVTVSYCYAYITGVHDSVRAYETWLRFREFCVPLAASQADLRRAFVDYLDKHAEAASGEAASVVVVALKDRFACDVATGSKR